MRFTACASVVVAISASAPAWALAEEDAQMIQKVEAGQVDTADASWWGFNEDDATDALQSAINSGAARVIVPDMGTPWMVRETIELASNQTVVFEEGVVVEAKEGRFHDRYDFLFVAVETENLKLEGYGATLRMRKSDYQSDAYTHSEWRHLLALYSVKDVEIVGLTFEASGGDGIYIGISGTQGTTRTNRPNYCENVVIRDVVCRDNHRQGISVISVRGLLIEDTVLETTSGTPPQAGIDFEPFRDDQVIQDVVMRNCLTRNNAGGGYMIWLPSLKEPVSIRLENCRSVGDRDGLRVRTNSASQRHLEGVIEVVDCRFEDSRGRGIAIEKSHSQPMLRIVDSALINPVVDDENRRPIMFHSSAGAVDPVGGVVFENLEIHDPLDRTPIGYTDFAGGLPLEAVTGTLRLVANGSEREVELTPERLSEWTEVDEWVDLPRFTLDGLELEPESESELADYGFEGARVRGRSTDTRFVLYAEQGDTVTLRLDHAQLGRLESQALRVQVLDPAGDVVHEVEAPFQDETDVQFSAETTGIYRIQTDRIRNTLAVTESSHRVNLAVGDDRLNLKQARGEFYFWVPRGTEEFTLDVSGEGSSEAIQARLINPDGDVVYHVDDTVAVRQFAVEYPGPAPSRGEVWTLQLDRPSSSSMHFGDVHIDIRGIPPLLAPSREALLRPRD
ncbi:hypothetical protein ACERK3_14035 [Phycisphaerales bacterium AB-hyl4]|uniref:Right handed beta helix domain-containing protein n=1 Tax=Natronomicrosphaera hydrolytica TaxID=3242702 RepID=A0ABV4U739_9BACT